jgi:peptidoglycan/LPS O-acetylase OafA/YrhL
MWQQKWRHAIRPSLRIEAALTAMNSRLQSSLPSAADLPASHLAESRLPALDGIRGVAVLMILVFHFWQSMYHLPAAAPLQSHLRFLAGGQTGVDLFFVLSGFLITGILLNAKGTPHFLRNFYVRRAVRILPLYYLVVCGYFAAGWINSGFYETFNKEWWYFPYLQNVGMTFWPHQVGEPGHFWSLGVEEHFYLFWPCLVLLCDERRLPKVLLAIIAAAMGFRLLLIPFVGADNIFWFSPCRLDALALGALLAVVVRRPELAETAHQTCRWTLMILGPTLLVLYPLTSGKGLFVMQTVKYLLVAVAFTALLGTTIGPGRWPWLERFFSTRFLCWCGKYSYAMYVFHPIIYIQITDLLRPNVSLATTHPNLYLACEFPLLLGVVFFVSWASWHLFEKHFLKLKSHFEYAVPHH